MKSGPERRSTSVHYADTHAPLFLNLLRTNNDDNVSVTYTTDHINESYQQTIKKRKKERKEDYPRLCEPEASERGDVSFRHVLSNATSSPVQKVSPRLRAIVPAANLRYIRRGKFVLSGFILYGNLFKRSLFY